MRELIGAGDMFTGGPRPQNAGRAIFRQLFGGNREPVEMAPLTPLNWYGDTAPIQRFSPPSRANTEETLKAAARIVDEGQPSMGRASRRP